MAAIRELHIASERCCMKNPTRLAPENRQACLERMETEHFDIVIVGGGLPGAGAALDAATRPLTLSKPQDPLVVQAACRTEPGLIGAAVLALQGDADGA